MRYLHIGIILFGFFSGVGLSVYTQDTTPPPVIITEIGAYEPVGREWVEIYNTTDQNISIQGWKFWEQGVQHALAPDSVNNFTLASHEYAVIVQDKEQFLQAYPNVTSSIFDSSWSSLALQGEEIGLRDQTGSVVEKFTYIPSGQSSIERINNNLADYTEVNWKSHPSANTVGRQNLSSQTPETDESDNSDECVEVPAEVFVQTSTCQSVVNDNFSFQVTIEVQLDNHIFTFTPKVNGNVQSDLIYVWNFGDGDVATSSQPTHAYQLGGTYQVVVTTEIESLLVSSTTEIIAPTTTISNPNIKINEFVPVPMGSAKEWVELYNPENQDIFLDGWSLEDGTGKSQLITSTIPAHGFLVVEFSTSRLNNSGDIIVLKNSQGGLVDDVIYGDWVDVTNAPAAKEAESVMRKIDGQDTDNDVVDFVTTTITSFGVANILSQPQTTTTTTSTQIVSYSGVLLYEIFPNPIGSDETEYIALKNITNQSINLFGWKLRDASKQAYIFPSTTIPANTVLRIQRSDTSISLNNSGEEMVTLSSPSGDEVDTVEYSGVVEEGALFQKNGSVWVWKQPNRTYSTEEIKAQTSKQKATAQTNTTSADNNIKKIKITEFLPNPFENDEFIELYNPGEEAVSLVNLMIDDIEGGSKPYTIVKELIIEPHGYAVFTRDQTGIALNNDADTVRLLIAGTSFFEVSYKASINSVGMSYAFINDEWVWTAKPTPTHVNFLVSEVDASAPDVQAVTLLEDNVASVITISEAKESEVGTKVRVEGVVSVLPGVFGKQYFYVSQNGDSSDGIQVYMYNKQFPSLKIGNLVEINGEIAETGHEQRIKVKKREDIVVKKEIAELIATEVGQQQLHEIPVGALVQLTANIIEIKGSTVYLDYNGEEVEVLIKPNTSINKKDLVVGSEVVVTGILVQPKNVYQILPRQISDIILLPKQEAEGEMRSSTQQASYNQYQTSTVVSTLEKTKPLPLWVISLLCVPFFVAGIFFKRKKLQELWLHLKEKYTVVGKY